MFSAFGFAQPAKTNCHNFVARSLVFVFYMTRFE